MKMMPATTPPAQRDRVRLMAVDPRAARAADFPFVHLAELLAPGDLLVVNDAATLPAALAGVTADGAAVELRLVGPPAVGDDDDAGGDADGALWHAAVLGAGDWRTPTEHRPLPPSLPPGTRVVFGLGPALEFGRGLAAGALSAEIVAHSGLSPRLVLVRFDRSGDALWQALYAAGKPIQYSYLGEDVALWSVQTAFAARPWAMEMPSAGRAITGAVLHALRRRGVGVAWLTHAAGLSATGDPAIDAALPLPERYDIPAATVRAIAHSRGRGGRVIAVGTTVVRALEGCVATHGRLRPGRGVTDLVITAGFRPVVIHGLLTGMHEPESSHYRLLQAFAPAALLDASWEQAARLGYRCHELGDTSLIVPGVLETTSGSLAA
jgi:S-adenosylmethionine:tRNA ribosyltransferase-isomerase